MGGPPGSEPGVPAPSAGQVRPLPTVDPVLSPHSPIEKLREKSDRTARSRRIRSRRNVLVDLGAGYFFLLVSFALIFAALSVAYPVLGTKLPSSDLFTVWEAIGALSLASAAVMQAWLQGRSRSEQRAPHLAFRAEWSTTPPGPIRWVPPSGDLDPFAGPLAVRNIGPGIARFVRCRTTFFVAPASAPLDFSVFSPDIVVDRTAGRKGWVEIAPILLPDNDADVSPTATPGHNPYKERHADILGVALECRANDIDDDIGDQVAQAFVLKSNGKWRWTSQVETEHLLRNAFEKTPWPKREGDWLSEPED